MPFVILIILLFATVPFDTMMTYIVKFGLDWYIGGAIVCFSSALNVLWPRVSKLQPMDQCGPWGVFVQPTDVLAYLCQLLWSQTGILE